MIGIERNFSVSATINGLAQPALARRTDFGNDALGSAEFVASWDFFAAVIRRKSTIRTYQLREPSGK